MFLANARETTTLILLGVCLIPLIAIIVFALIKMIKFAAKKPLLHDGDLDEELLKQREVFYTAFGGEENVTLVAYEMRRLTIDVVEIEKVDAEKLKELGAAGVLLVGNQVKCGFGDRAEKIYNIMK